MRFVDRNSVSMPPELANAASPAARERDKVRRSYADPDAETYNFTAYKKKGVVDAINELFKNKCAYCEARYSATSPTDVEHFRPKASVVGEAGHRGYWWLASDWNNLLAACIFCNRKHNHDLFNIVAGDWGSCQIASGKHDNFPLAGGARAFTDSDDITAEDPLLIDPTQRDPAKYIAWCKLNELQVIVPLEEDGETTKYAAESIRVYGLNRRGLVEARTEAALAIEADARAIAADILYATELEGEQLAKFMPRLTERVGRFNSLMKGDPQYLGMIEHLVKKSIDEITADLETLKAKFPVVSGE